MQHKQFNTPDYDDPMVGRILDAAEATDLVMRLAVSLVLFAIWAWG